jgi:hypothetical protein
MTTMRRMLGALVPVLCTVACGQTVGAGGAGGAGDGGAFADAGSLDAGTGGGSTIDAGRGVLDDPNFPPYEATLQRGPEHWVSGQGETRLGESMSLPAVNVPYFSITRSPITNREFAQCVHAGACKLEIVDSPNCRPDATFWGNVGSEGYQKIEHLAWIFRNTTLNKGLWDAPITCLKYEQAEKYCDWIDAKLPTVPQFYFAARPANTAYTTGMLFYPWGQARPTCEQSANAESWASKYYGEQLYFGCCGKDCDDPSLYTVGTHPAGASPMGMQDVLMTPSEHLRRGTMPNVRPELPCFAIGFYPNDYAESAANPAMSHRLVDTGCSDSSESTESSGSAFRCVR